MKQKTILISLIIIALIILLLLISSFTHDAVRLHRSGTYHFSTHGATVSDVNSISSWMTFGYINKSFGLPTEYLKTALDITDPNYPNITISHITKEKKLEPDKFVEIVRGVVSSYLEMSSTAN